jgi:hypothetical protein
MFKKGPKEKEKILRRLTEREIKEQLYGFGGRENFSPIPQTPPTPKDISKESPPQSNQKPSTIKNMDKPKSKNPYLLLHIILLVVFLMVIWFSIRQIIKIVSVAHSPAISKVSQVKNEVPRAKNRR